MLYRIQRFGIQQTSKMAGIVYFVLGIALIPFFYIATIAPQPAGAPPKENMSPGLLFLLPFVYGLIGYVMTAFVLFIYNRIAKGGGGVELDIVYAVEPAAEHGAPSAPSP